MLSCESMFRCRKLVIRHYYFFFAVFFLATFLAAAFLGAAFLGAAFFATAFLATFFLVAAFFFATFFSSAKTETRKRSVCDDNSHMLASRSFPKSRKSPTTKVLAVATALIDPCCMGITYVLGHICTKHSNNCNMILTIFKHISDIFPTEIVFECERQMSKSVTSVFAFNNRSNHTAALASCWQRRAET